MDIGNEIIVDNCTNCPFRNLCDTGQKCTLTKQLEEDYNDELFMKKCPLLITPITIKISKKSYNEQYKKI